MGADIYLESIWVPFAEKLSPLTPTPGLDLPDALSALDDYFEGMQASGGYFRNSYNAGDVLWAMGLSWPAVGKMLDQGDYLPLERARELVEIIEARPLTRQQVAAHIFENLIDGVERHPFIGLVQRSLERALAETGEEPRIGFMMFSQPPDVDSLFGFLNASRNQLLAILRKSIDLNEPLYCDL